MVSEYVDGNDANSLQHPPVAASRGTTPGAHVGRGASAPIVSRLAYSVDRKDFYRRTYMLVDHFIANSPRPLAATVLDLDHSDDPPMASRNLRSIITLAE
jgi:hypothetical protein